MIDLDKFLYCEHVWPNVLKPYEVKNTKEPFSIWWNRNYKVLDHLPQRLCEQWVYKHWSKSPFGFLPIETLRCTSSRWNGDEFLRLVYRSRDEALDPDEDYHLFQRQGGDTRHPTAKALDEGTWDYPVILLATPDGVIDFGNQRPDVRYVLVEGHQRHRYLNALHARGEPPAGPHEIYIITSPLVISEEQGSTI